MLLFFSSHSLVKALTFGAHIENRNKTLEMRVYFSHPQHPVADSKTATRPRAGVRGADPKGRGQDAHMSLVERRIAQPIFAKSGGIPLDCSRASLTIRPLLTAEVGMPEQSRRGSRTLNALTPRRAGS